MQMETLSWKLLVGKTCGQKLAVKTFGWQTCHQKLAADKTCGQQLVVEESWLAKLAVENLSLETRSCQNLQLGQGQESAQVTNKPHWDQVTGMTPEVVCW